MTALHCTTCGREFRTLTPELITARGCVWHRPCANVDAYSDGEEYVDFPSDGMLAPSTIISTTATQGEG